MKSQRFAERDPLAGEKGERHAPKTESVATAFLELFQLLEEYAPSWYTEEIRNHAESAANPAHWGLAQAAFANCGPSSLARQWCGTARLNGGLSRKNPRGTAEQPQPSEGERYLSQLRGKT